MTKYRRPVDSLFRRFRRNCPATYPQCIGIVHNAGTPSRLRFASTRTSITKLDDCDGPSYQTCADAGWVFKKFHFSRRHENLSWSQGPFIRSVQNIANMYCLVRGDG